jgi:hypothetical protein
MIGLSLFTIDPVRFVRMIWRTYIPLGSRQASPLSTEHMAIAARCAHIHALTFLRLMLFQPWSAVGLLGTQRRKSSLQRGRSHRRSDSWQMPLNSETNNRRTHVSSVGGMKGFGRNASGVFLLRIVLAVSPDIIIILISDRFFRTLSASSKPVIRGIVLSVRSK